jgi:hypothetical protein
LEYIALGGRSSGISSNNPAFNESDLDFNRKGNAFNGTNALQLTNTAMNAIQASLFCIVEREIAILLEQIEYVVNINEVFTAYHDLIDIFRVESNGTQTKVARTKRSAEIPWYLCKQ